MGYSRPGNTQNCGYQLRAIFVPQRTFGKVAQMVKNLPAMMEIQVQPWVERLLWRREWLPTPVFLPGESHGQKSLAGYSPWNRKEQDTTEMTQHSWISHSCHKLIYYYVYLQVNLGEGNGYPLQYFCLENLMDRRAWQATVHGVSKSQTQLSD